MVTNFYRLIQGDALEVLPTMDDHSIDCVVTDPPYGIGFMGKDWDKALPPKQAFAEMLRVLKPGALAFIMSSPRQDVLWRMLSMLEEVGFELRQSFLSWVYASGFPKAYDVSKGIDKKLGKKRKMIMLKGSMPIQTSGRRNAEASSEGKFERTNNVISEPVSDLAKKWQGWKSQTGLKPALECILMVNKPRSEKTIVDNVLRWGTGAINVDETRISFLSDKPESVVDYSRKGIPHAQEDGGRPWIEKRIKNGLPIKEYNPNQKGRFPANLLCGLGIDLNLDELLSLQEELKNEES